MVKFASGNEARSTITAIINMIKKKLEIPITPTFTNLSLGKELPVLQPPGYVDKKNNRGLDDNKGFDNLALFDTIFVIDDTGSMQLPADSTEANRPGIKTRWDVLTQSMQYMGNIAAEFDPDGVDIQFLKSDLNRTNVKSGQEVLNLLSHVDLEKGVGGTHFATVLAEILGPYVARYSDYFEATKRREKADKVRPLNIIVLTDGKADDEKSTKRTIIKIGKQLDRMNAPETQVGIQFLQVGDDEDAAKWLRSLDDELEDVHDVRDVSQMFCRSFGSSEAFLVLN